MSAKIHVYAIIALVALGLLGLFAASSSSSSNSSSSNHKLGSGGRIIYDPDAPTYALPAQALVSSSIPFSNHSTDLPFQSYLQQTLNFAHFKDLFDNINATVGTLQSRGEAHITVVTPTEFDRVLKPAGVTIGEIEAIAMQGDIQKARLAPVCLGRFAGELPNPANDADAGRFLLYSLVVADIYNDLANIRREVFKLYRSKGGQGVLFQPEGFWPHVTIGFDRRDLFIEDGLYKGSNYCYAPIRVTR
ncbi:hypothetical protein H4R99_003139 [Coemansia sp. RSA 1722]|nr:hypothetical protein IWW45_006348 [Coemansia sp. RSA 485]KAJ2601024.1 hypothetical protein H4R99_003139 [Coemansia sp. RSA 1722]KAJ2602313.1 hypothetical protein GGF39_000803 [Coemansia sp. RSA 1721]KAJ2640472.1 hypothetical protein GGF40_000120 [Coemansia sp. RSA 1286]